MSAVTLLRVYLRLFLLQACWNVERWQNLGVLFAVLPALRKIYADPKDLEKAVERHLQSFNTHPYMAPLILGASLHFESRGEGGGQRADAIRAALSAPFAAIGDSFFWGVLRPFCGLLAAVFSFSGSVLAPFVFLIVYNFFHLPLRTLGFRRGLHDGDRVVGFVRWLAMPTVAAAQRILGAAVLGGLLAGLPWMTLRIPLDSGLSLSPYVGLGLMVPTGVAAILLSRRGMSPVSLVYLVAAIALGAALAGA